MLQSVGGETNTISANVNRVQSIIASVADERTPQPPLNAANAQSIAAIRAADTQREQRLRSIEKQLGQTTSELDALQTRLNAIGSDVQNRFAPQLIAVIDSNQKSELSVDTAIAFVGLLCAFATLFLGVRQDHRETEMALHQAKAALARCEEEAERASRSRDI